MAIAVPETGVAANLAIVRERIALAAQRSGRAASDITLVAVTKTVPVERILEAIAAGATSFGENRVQEAEAKYVPRSAAESRDLVSRSGIVLHMIGTLQRNKARRAVALFDFVQSVDRSELADALEKAAAVERPDLKLPVLLEVNLTGEPSKSGVAPEELPRLADAVVKCPHLIGMGLMTIARLSAQEAELHSTFGGLRHLLEQLQASHPGEWVDLSMGMTDDYEYAIEEGATIVRLGRAIFGERKT